jgi:exopolysaccharide production protein ExoZ
MTGRQKIVLGTPVFGRLNISPTTTLKFRMNWLTQRFELTRGDKGRNVQPMEGLRGFAVFLVFLVHYVTFIDPWLAPNSLLGSFAAAIHTIGNSGVDLFFVLSGYLIYGSLISKPQPFLRFLSRRIERIYPAFVAVFSAYVVLSFIIPSESKIPAPAFAGSVYLIQNFLLLPGILPIEPMITVAWSLSYEMFYYLVIPLVISLFGLRHRSVEWRLRFFFIIVTAAGAYCAAFGGPVRLIMFVSGILLFETMERRRIRAPGGAFALLALCAGLMGTLLPWQGSGAGALKSIILFVSFFVLCFSCFSYPTSSLGMVFSWTPLRWLGNMSYSYYLLHGISLKATFLCLSFFLPVTELGPLFFWGLLAPMFALTLVPTAALFLLVERPFSLAPGRVRTGGQKNIEPQPLRQHAQG